MNEERLSIRVAMWNNKYMKCLYDGVDHIKFNSILIHMKTGIFTMDMASNNYTFFIVIFSGTLIVRPIAFG